MVYWKAGPMEHLTTYSPSDTRSPTVEGCGFTGQLPGETVG